MDTWKTHCMWAPSTERAKTFRWVNTFFPDSQTSPALEVRLMPNWADFLLLTSRSSIFFSWTREHGKLNWCRPFCIDTTLLTLAILKNKWHPGYFDIFFCTLLLDFSFMLCDCLCTINFNNNSNNSWLNLLSRVRSRVLSAVWGESMVNHRSQIVEHSQ